MMSAILAYAIHDRVTGMGLSYHEEAAQDGGPERGLDRQVPSRVLGWWVLLENGVWGRKKFVMRVFLNEFKGRVLLSLPLAVP